MLADLRREIDDIDKQILTLLAKRFAIVKRIGVFKKQNNMPLKDEKREEEKLRLLEAQAQHEGISIALIYAIWKDIFKISYEIEEKTNA